MKHSVFLLSLLLSTGLAFSQPATVNVDQLWGGVYTGPIAAIDFPTHDFAGEVVEIGATGPSEVFVKIIFNNTTASTIDWRISRRRIGVDPLWFDFLSFGHADDIFGGNLIDANSIDMEVWTATGFPFIITVNENEGVQLGAHITPDFNATGCGTYRYYVGTVIDPFQDSVDIQVCHYLGIDEGSEFELSFAPNPASDNFEISSESNQELSFSIVNSLGQIMDSGSFTKTHKVNVSQFENGVYFVTVLNDKIALKTERIVVNH